MMEFPDQKRFAFTILDDTDFATLRKIEPVYRFLADLGFRTTKTVWPLPSSPAGAIGGASLADDDYRRFILWLHEEGFEMALHGVRNHDALRWEVINGLEAFRSYFGRYPRTHCNHLNNRDNLYWGPDRFTTALPRSIFHLYRRLTDGRRYEGNRPGSPYFWGDLCLDKIDYVRNLVFEEINLLKINPTLPYRNPAQPYVRFWFSSTFGDKAPSFCRNVSEEKQDRLEAEAGVCIMYTHFGLRFCENGKLNPEFVRLMKRLSLKNGWFVPVATVLDHLRSRQAQSVIPRRELRRMEHRWLRERLLRRSN